MFILTPLRIISFALFGFMLCRLGLYLVHSEYFSVLNWREVSQALIKGFQFDAATTMLFCSPMLILLSLPFKPLQQGKFKIGLVWLSGIVIFAMLVYSLGDLTYFGEVQRHIGAELLNLSEDKGALVELALSSRLPYTLASLLFLSVMAVIWWCGVLKPAQQAVRLPHWFARLGLWLGLALLYFVMFRGFILSSRPISLADAFDGSKLQQANLALNPVFTSYRESKNRLSEKPLKLVSTQDLQNFVQKSPLIFQWQHPQNQPTGKNVVLILLESWSYKYIDGLAGGKYGVTPFMDSLIAKSQVWDRYYAAGQRSIIGIQAVLSSVPSLQNQPVLGFGLELKEMSRIAEIANRYQYRTLMMQSSARRSFHMESIANALGFQEYYGKEDVPLHRQYPQEQPRFGWDYDALQFFNQQLSKGDQRPFFAFMFTGTTHEPFPKIGEEFEVYPHDSQNEKGFLNTLKYSDWALAEFMKQAEKQDWYRNTIFIFTADHTLNADGKMDLPQQFHIPLVIFAPDGSLPAKRDQTLASQYDLLPSMMDLMGFNPPIYTFGKSLFSAEQSEAVMLNRGDIVGVLASPNQWLGFTEQGVKEQGQEILRDKTREVYHNIKLKMQYADELLRNNRWTTPLNEEMK